LEALTATQDGWRYPYTMALEHMLPECMSVLLVQPNSTETELSQPGHQVYVVREADAESVPATRYNFTVTHAHETTAGLSPGCPQPNHRPFWLSLEGLPWASDTYQLRVGNWRRFEHVTTTPWLRDDASVQAVGATASSVPQLYVVMSPFFGMVPAVAVALTVAHCRHHRRWGCAGTYLYLRTAYLAAFQEDNQILALMQTGYLQIVHWDHIVPHYFMDFQRPMPIVNAVFQKRSNFREELRGRHAAIPYHDQVTYDNRSSRTSSCSMCAQAAFHHPLVYTLCAIAGAGF